jgi:hypothetical protein
MQGGIAPGLKAAFRAPGWEKFLRRVRNAHHWRLLKNDATLLQLRRSNYKLREICPQERLTPGDNP